MGVLYIVFPLERSDLRGYLNDLGVQGANSPLVGRNPSAVELRKVLRDIVGLEVTIVETETDGIVQIRLDPRDNSDGPYACLNVHDHTCGRGDVEFGFEKGSPELNVYILACIAEICGPQVIIPDTGCDPLVVFGRSGIWARLDRWEHTRGYLNSEAAKEMALVSSPTV